jgi:hypothetical protein
VSAPTRPLVALISTTPVAMAPASAALAAEFPEAGVWNVLDDRLLTDANDSGGLTPELAARMRRLIDYAVGEGAAAVLVTCSVFGPVARTVESPPVPVVAPDDGAFAEALAGGYDRILVVASLPGSLRDAQERLEAAVAAAGADIEVRGVTAEGAFNATAAGDLDAVVTALRSACETQAGSYDAVLLAQYSLAPAAARLTEGLGVPVISGPASAARSLRQQLTPA